MLPHARHTYHVFAHLGCFHCDLCHCHGNPTQDHGGAAQDHHRATSSQHGSTQGARGRHLTLIVVLHDELMAGQCTSVQRQRQNEKAVGHARLFGRIKPNSLSAPCVNL